MKKLFLLALVLVACGPDMERGVVHGHSYEPSYTTTTPIMQFSPARYELLVWGLNEKGQPDSQWVDVSEKAYWEYVDDDSIYFDVPH